MKYLAKILQNNETAKHLPALTKIYFPFCSALENVTIGNEVKTIGQYSFYGCSALENVTLGNKVETIGAYSFINCSSLPQIKIPASVKTINNCAFRGCTGLKNLIIDDREGELTLGCDYSEPLFADCPLDSVYIGGNISYSTSSSCGYSPFYRNKSLRTVVITNKEVEISANEFYGCANLQSFTIGDGVKKFGDWAFSGCSSLQSLVFGSQLESIGKEAFSDCAAVTQIVSRAAVAPTCSTQALDDINKWTCQLYVPKECMASYQAADQWKEFFFIQEGDGQNGGGGGTPEPKQCAKPTISYQNGKLTFDCATEGATCHSNITDTDIANHDGNEVELTATYQISVYATAPGYENSETATATLCWIEATPHTEGMSDGIAQVQARAVMIQTNNGNISISGAEDGEQVVVYGVNGEQHGSAVVKNGVATVPTFLPAGSIAVAKIGQRAVKIVIK